jgi:membrane protease YdiL (CAAX protease family)
MPDTQSPAPIAPDSQDESAHARSERTASRAVGEVAVGFVLILLTLWISGLAQLVLGGATLAWMLLITVRARPTAEQLGLRVAGTRRALWIVALAAIAAVLGVWISVRLHTFHAVFRNYAVEWGFLAYIVWALVQQFILQDFFLARLVRITPSRTLAVVVAGLLFAVAHIPNPLLVIATVVWGIVACALFLRYRNLYVLGLAHAILGMCIAIAVPNAVHHHMRVGLGYLQWHAPAAAQTQAQRRAMSHLGINNLTNP